MVMAGWIIIGILVVGFVGCAVCAAIASARERRQESGVSIEPEQSEHGSDFFGGC